MKKAITTLAVLAALTLSMAAEAGCRYIYVNNQPVWVCD
jgi:hypothetical protein